MYRPLIYHVQDKPVRRQVAKKKPQQPWLSSKK